MSNTSNELPSWLIDLKARGDGLQTPDNYFEDLERGILEKTAGISRESHSETGMRVLKAPEPRSWYRRTPVWAAAAVLAGALTVAWWFMRPAGDNNSVELSDEDLQAYILENARDFEPEQLASISPEHVQEETAKPLAPNTTEDHSTQDEIRPEDLEHLLNDLSDEELQEIL